ncbi:MAG: lactate utilization protein [Endomicrobiia bacterium]
MKQDENIRIFNKKLLENIKNKLVSNGFKNTEIFDDIISAKKYICSLIGDGKKIGVGGSQTIRSVGLLDDLIQQNNEIITHTKDMDYETRIQTWLKAQSADFYLASPQAVTYNGEIIFIDAYGNRVSACIYGPKKVILIFGYNKIVKDIESGIWRARNVAAVVNNIRLQRDNPCVSTGKCEDCSSTSRICNVLTILYKKPTYTEYEIIMINDILGY